MVQVRTHHRRVNAGAAPVSRIVRVHPAGPAPRRRGFTLLELLIVIGLIAALAAIILPAVQGAFSRGRDAEAAQQFRDLQTALDSFKAKYGEYPPSNIMLFENPADWAAAPQELAKLVRLWPNYTPAVTDFNGDGDAADSPGSGGSPLYLDGAECLAFFLGGMMVTNIVDQTGALQPGATAGTLPNQWSPQGFSGNPVNPFERGSQGRIEFYDFSSVRLVDGNEASDAATAAASMPGTDGMPSMLDSYPEQRTPIAYLKASPLGTYAVAASSAGYDTAVGAPTTAVYSVVPQDVNNASLSSAYGNALGEPFAKKSYQLISPGIDGVFGAGGVWSAEDGFPSNSSNRAQFEGDNVTSFSNGRLR